MTPSPSSKTPARRRRRSPRRAAPARRRRSSSAPTSASRSTRGNVRPQHGGTGACRVRTFHGKLSDQGLEYIDEAINVWLDDHPEIDIKFVTTNVGMFDGKFKDLALIVNVWY